MTVERNERNTPFLEVTFSDGDNSDNGKWSVRIQINDEDFNELYTAIEETEDNEPEEMFIAILDDWLRTNLRHKWKLKKGFGDSAVVMFNEDDLRVQSLDYVEVEEIIFSGTHQECEQWIKDYMEERRANKEA